MVSYYFWFMTGKSSWVPSRTQGSIPMLFCRWSNVLWLLHPLSVPSYGWWLDQGRWSLRLFFAFVGMTELWHCIRLIVCVVISNYEASATWRTWFVIILRTPMYFMNVVIWMYLWMATAKLITILAVCDVWFEILRDFTDYRDYMGLSVIVRLCKWSLLGLISYNLVGSVTAGIGARFSELLFISTF